MAPSSSDSVSPIHPPSLSARGAHRPSFQDLIMSYLGLHWTNDLPGALTQNYIKFAFNCTWLHLQHDAFLFQFIEYVKFIQCARFYCNSTTYKVMEERCSEKELYMCQVLKYEDPVRQEATLNMVPVDELKEKALISLAKLEKRLPIAYMFSVSTLYYRHVSLNNRRQSMKDIIVNNSVLMLIGVESRPRRAWLMSTREAGSSTEDETQDSRSLSCSIFFQAMSYDVLVRATTFKE
ncbi:hypothetical protein TRIUR3_29391 [Triticum urartu]|uniref:Uncharacterized protein n=1 Tax=Triticum urartu TaxID=4572 RepID=M8A0B2_TRIUA|nr:hypothetical protein TRIUR3_29391 [Triticum urartu]